MVGIFTTPVCRLMYLIENDSEDIKLSPEHSEFKWISENEIENYQFKQLNNCQPLEQILKKAFKMYA